MEEVENTRAVPEISDSPEPATGEHAPSEARGSAGPPPTPPWLSDVARQLRWFLWHYPERREASADELRREMWGYPPLYRAVSAEEITAALRELAELEKSGEAEM